MGKYSTEIKWGIIFTIIALLWMLLEKSLGWHDEKIAQHATYTNIFSIIAITVFVFALLDKRKTLGGTMSWKEGFISGAIISVVVMILAPLSQYLTTSIISPEYFSNAINYAVESEQLTQTEAEAFFNYKSYALMASFGGLIMGLITSAVVAFFVKKDAIA